jgi:hypothetical protein
MITSATNSSGICSFLAISIGIVPSRSDRNTFARILVTDFLEGMAPAKQFGRAPQVFESREISGG